MVISGSRGHLVPALPTLPSLGERVFDSNNAKHSICAFHPNLSSRPHDSPSDSEIAGVGEGTGAAFARRFAKAYTVVLLTRKVESLRLLVKEIQSDGGEAIALNADVSRKDSVDSAFARIIHEIPGAKAAVCVSNASSRPVRKPFLELSLQDITQSCDVSV